jgi:SNF2 family DNA or RNA helicase
MEIIDNKYLEVRTRNPSKIIQSINNSQVVPTNRHGDVSTVAVTWELQEAQKLYELKFKNVPSPINRDYDWPGVYPPMAHQRKTSEFLTLNTRAFVFNEQGTGKTASAIWASDYLIKAGYVRRVLIVCPLSIMQAAWQADLFKFAVHRSVGIAHGDPQKRQNILIGNYKYVVINFDGATIEADCIAKNDFDLIIIDEANAYKNVSTKRWKSMNKIIDKDKWLWMMTGTPAAQSPFDAYGLAKLCVPHKVPRHSGAFKDSVMLNISRFKWVPKSDAANTIHNVLQPAIRFTKEQCLDLPDVVYVDRESPMTPQQTKYYNLVKKDFLVESEGEEISSANAAVNLNKLLQISGGAVYSDSGAVLEFDVSNRLSVVEEVINEASHKVLVFVPFTHTIQVLKNHLTNLHIPCEVISGAVPATKRNDIIQRFQTKDKTDIKVLIIQPAAAAHGVTLTAADTIVWYSPVTSTEIYLQANARINRHGQKNAMTIVHIQGTEVERKLYKMLQTRLTDHAKLVDLYKQVLTE